MSDAVMDLSSLDVVALIVKPGEVLVICDTQGTMVEADAAYLQDYLRQTAPDVKVIVVSGEGLQLAKVIQDSGVLRVMKAQSVECRVCGLKDETRHRELEANGQAVHEWSPINV